MLKVGDIYRSSVEARVTDEVEVLVAGGGTAGVVAAIAAARSGAGVLLVERRGCLGGMMTSGNAGLTKFIMHDSRQAQHRMIVDQLEHDPASVQVVGGIAMEITNRLIKSGGARATKGKAGSYVFTSQEKFKLLLLDMMEEAGVKLLLHSQIVDVIADKKNVRGVVVENKSGREIVLCKMVIDATGDGDVAAKAGAPFVLGIGTDDPSAKSGMRVGSMQHMGIMFQMGNVKLKNLFDYLQEYPDRFYVQRFSLQSLAEARSSHAAGDMMTIDFCSSFGPERVYQVYNNPVEGIVTLCCPCYEGSGLDVRDLTRGQIQLIREIHIWAKDLIENVPGFENSFLINVPEIGVRETRHIRGAYVLSIEDIVSQKEFGDTIGRGSHPIDVGEVPDELQKQALRRWYYNIPYRCLAAQNIDNVLLAGRCISVTHEASGCIRTTVPCMITGQAAGLAAGLCVQQGVTTHSLDTSFLCKKLIEAGAVL